VSNGFEQLSHENKWVLANVALGVNPAMDLALHP